MHLKNWLKGAAIGAAGLLTPLTDADAQEKDYRQLSDQDVPDKVEEYIDTHSEEDQKYLTGTTDPDNDNTAEMYFVHNIWSDTWKHRHRENETIGERQTLGIIVLNIGHRPFAVFYEDEGGNLKRQIYDKSNEAIPFLNGDATQVKMNQYGSEDQRVTSVYKWNKTDKAYDHVRTVVEDESEKNNYQKLVDSDKYTIYPVSDATRIKPWQPDRKTVSENDK